MIDVSDEKLYFVFGTRKTRGVSWTNSEYSFWHPNCSADSEKSLEATKHLRRNVILHRMRWDDYDTSHLVIF